MSGFVEAGIAYAIMLGLLFRFTYIVLQDIGSLKAELESLYSNLEEE